MLEKLLGNAQVIRIMSGCKWGVNTKSMMLKKGVMLGYICSGHQDYVWIQMRGQYEEHDAQKGGDVGLHLEYVTKFVTISVLFSIINWGQVLRPPFTIENKYPNS